MPVPRFLLGGVGLHALPPEGEAILGRGPDCEVVLDFAQISRQHARLRIGETCVLTDLGSRNGTLLRGKRLRRGEARPLEYGDSFSVGPVSLLLVPPSSVATEQLTRARLWINDSRPTPRRRCCPRWPGRGSACSSTARPGLE